MPLTDTQLVVLSAAVARDDGSILPLPGHIKGGAVSKVCAALLAKGLAVELTARKGDRIWREAGDGRAMKLVATDTARDALGITIEAPDEPAAVTVPATVAPASKNTRPNTKQAQLIAMLKTPEGASIDEIVAAFDWQPHTVRGAIAGALKKKLGLKVESEQIGGRGRVYRIVG
jgi:hypothetical protein